MENSKKSIIKALSVALILALVFVVLPPLRATAEEGDEVSPEASGEIIAFAEIEDEITVQLGTKEADLPLPATLMATVRLPDTATPTESAGTEVSVDVPVTWASGDYDADKIGKYLFTAIDDSKKLTVTTKQPEVTVIVAESLIQPFAFGAGARVTTLQQLKDAIAAAPIDDTLYEIEIAANIQLDGNITIATGKNIKIWSSVAYTITAARFSPLFTVKGKLALENWVTLMGGYLSNGEGGGILVDGGTFDMNGGEIRGSTIADGDGYKCMGGGVQVYSGRFNLSGGKISEVYPQIPNEGAVNIGANASFIMSNGVVLGDSALGICIKGGTFTMQGGVVSDNSTTGNGGGVYLSGGTFTMKGGTISGNHRLYGGVNATENALFIMNGGTISGNGRGVNIDENSSFIMNNGKITDNATTAVLGGGVYVKSGTFTMNNGEISGNSAESGGGVGCYGTFTMNGGKIINNTANGTKDNAGGGGIAAFYDGVFNMNGGELKNNTAARRGGGVYLYNNATFNIKGGEISKNIANGSNVREGGNGVYVNRAVSMANTFSVSGNPIINDGTICYDTAGYRARNYISIIDNLQAGARIIIEDGMANEAVASYTGSNNLTEAMAKAFVSEDGTLIGSANGSNVVLSTALVDVSELRIIKFNSPNWANNYTSVSEGYFTYNYFANNATTSILVNVEVTTGAGWALYNDSECTSEISDKTLTLDVGNNIAYIKITADGKEPRIVKLIINRGAGADDDDGQLKRYNITFHAGLADVGKQDVSMDIVWGWNLFSSSATTYDNRLAIVGLAMSAAAEKNETTLLNMFRRLEIVSSLNTGTLVDSGYQNFNYSGKWFEFDNVAYTLAVRKVKIGAEEHNLVVVVVRGTSDLGDIVNDIAPNGFMNCANEVYKNLELFLAKYGIDVDDNKNKYFITGHSLGGAVANLLGKRLADEVPLAKSNTFVYTFASPFTRGPSTDNPANIHNIVNKEDTVFTNWSVIYGLRWGNNRPFLRQDVPGMYAVFQKLTSGKDLSSIMDGKSTNTSKWALTAIKEFILDSDKIWCAHSPTTYMAYLLSEENLMYYNMRVVTIRCPVDVEVYTDNRTLVGKVSDNVVDYAFGNELFMNVRGDEKRIYLPLDNDYSIELLGTDTGKMSLTVEDYSMGTGSIVQQKTFSDVSLNSGKQMRVTIGDEKRVDQTRLYVLGSEENVITEILIDGTEVPIGNTGGIFPPTPVIWGINSGSGGASSSKSVSDTTMGSTEDAFPFRATTTKRVKVYNPDNTKKKKDALAKGADVTVIGIDGAWATAEYTKNGETHAGAIAIGGIIGKFGSALYGETTKANARLYIKNSRNKYVRAGLHYPKFGSKVKIVGLEGGHWVIDVKSVEYYIKFRDAKLIL